MYQKLYDKYNVSANNKQGAMEDTKNAISNLAAGAGEYIETNLHLLKLKAVAKSSEAVSSIISLIAVVLVFFVVLLFLNIGLAILIGESMGKVSYGFFIISGFYLIVGFVFFAFRNKWLKGPVDEMIIKKLLN